MSTALNILFAASEAVPFAKAGGLADVAGSLPGALRALGHDARLVLPHYALIDNAAWGIEPAFGFTLHRADGPVEVMVSRCEVNGVPVYLLDGCPAWFCGDEKLYYGRDIDIPRFLFFSQALNALIDELQARWQVDVVHVNDWHTGLVPFLLHQKASEAASLYTIHNIGYQGFDAGVWLDALHLPAREHSDLRWQNKTDNLMAMGIAYADAVNTVSPRYARELQLPEYGFGLDGLIRRRTDAREVFGVLNGIDVAARNPATDSKLAANYDAHNLAPRRLNKSALQQRAGLAEGEPSLLIGMVSRLAEQKGIDLVLTAIPQLLAEAEDVQFIILGTGQKHYMEALRQLQAQHPDRVQVFLEFGALHSQAIYSGCDIFLMPSRYEPCGIAQMFAMHYGALPLVRATGGLADTVSNYDNDAADLGTGFVFDAYTAEALLGTLRWARHTYFHRSEAWRRMQRRAMQTDFSWHVSAQEYIRRYQAMIIRRRAKLAEKVSRKT